jgi:hypothetical protein
MMESRIAGGWRIVKLLAGLLNYNRREKVPVRRIADMPESHHASCDADRLDPHSFRTCEGRGGKRGRHQAACAWGNSFDEIGLKNSVVAPAGAKP